MGRRQPSFRVSVLLALLLAAGPLRAHIVYACSVMDTVLQDPCCCDDAANRRASDCEDSNPLDAASPCCEQTVEISKDEQASPAVIPGGHKSDTQSDVDPPESTLPNSDWVIAPLNDSFVFCSLYSHQPVIAGKDTYLVTQRLHI